MEVFFVVPLITHNIHTYCFFYKQGACVLPSLKQLLNICKNIMKQNNHKSEKVSHNMLNVHVNVDVIV